MKAQIENRIIEDIYFVFQPIVHTTNDSEATIDSYEVLLRSKQICGFPARLFAEILKSREHTYHLFRKYMKMVSLFMENVPDVNLTINLSYQQLAHSSTWRFLVNCIQYKDRLVIEFTENTPEGFEGNNFFIGKDLEKVQELGYRIALDDVGSGMNSIQFVREHIKYLSWIKLSVLPLTNMERSELLEYIGKWVDFASHNQIRLVVEAVEDEGFADELRQRGISYQQGYLWGRASSL